MAVRPGPDGPRVEMRDLRGIALDEPFFEQTVARALREPSRRRSRVEVPLRTLADAAGAAEPAGFVFHASRCGSTLLARLLASLEDTVVVSEAPPVDDVLRIPDGDRAAGLRAVVGALAAAQPERQRLFVKLDAWHAQDMGLVRAVFPATPFVFLYRDPLEIVASHLREPGSHTVPGLLPPGLFGIDPGEAPTMAREDYCARVIGAILAAGARGAGDRCLLMEQASLPDGIGELLEHFGVPAGAAGAERLRIVAGQDAKRPSLPYAAREPARPPAPVRRAVDRWARAPYRELEALRTRQPTQPASC